MLFFTGKPVRVNAASIFVLFFFSRIKLENEHRYNLLMSHIICVCRKSGKINSYPTMQRSFFSVLIFSKSFTLTSLLFCIFLQEQEIIKSDTL